MSRCFWNLERKISDRTKITAPIWNYHFELMCDASDYVFSLVWGYRKDKKKLHVTTKKVLLAIVFALEKFRSYPIGIKVVIYTC